MKIYCPGGYTHGNRGDALLILSLDALLRERFGPRAQRVYATWTPEADTCAYGLPCVPMVVPLDGRLFRGLGQIAARSRRPDRIYVIAAAAVLLGIFTWSRITRLSPSTGLRLLPRRTRPAVAAILDADAVVTVPGGYLLAPVVGDFYVTAHILTIGTAVLLGKPVTISPCSIGPAAGWYEPLLIWLLRRVSTIVVRERTSLEWVRDRLAGNRPAPALVLATDLALADAVLPEGLRMDVPDGTIGVSVKRHTYPRSGDAAASHQRYVREMARFVEQLLSENDSCRVVFVPQVAAGGDNDVVVAHEVVELIGARVRDRVQVETRDLTPGQLRTLYGCLQIMIGTRMHANIISLLAGTPVVAIAYEAKTRGIMTRLGLERFVVDIEDVRADRLIDLSARADAEREDYLTTLRGALPGVRTEARDWLLADDVSR